MPMHPISGSTRIRAHRMHKIKRGSPQRGKAVTEELMDEKFSIFMETVDVRLRSFVSSIHAYLAENGCKCDIKLQKSGYVVSYIQNSSKRTLATFISRKTGMRLRIYPEHLQEYQTFLDTLPEKVKKEIKKASVCKRLIDPGACNPKCSMGYTFVLDGEQYQKCRYMAFQPALSEENVPYVMQFLQKELQFSADHA